MADLGQDRIKRMTEFTLGWAKVLVKLRAALEGEEGVKLDADEVKVLLEGIRAVARLRS